MNKLKTVLIVCSTLLMINCSLKATSKKPISVDNFWIQFLDILKNGDIEQVKLMTTDDGFKSLVNGISQENYSNWFKNLGNEWGKEKSNWTNKSEEVAKLSTGETDVINSIYHTTLVFIKIKDKWKFDLLLGAK